MNTEVDELAQKIWDYMLMHQPLEKADCIIALGSYDVRVAEHAAHLLLEGWAPLIVFTGGEVGYAKRVWQRTEADVFAEVAINLGVPPEKILKEKKALNTGENVALSRQLLMEHGINPKKVIAVQKPYMERRSYATFKKLWPDVDVIVTSQDVAFRDYPNQIRSKEEIINKIVGDFQRIKVYGENGFQIPQEIPAGVWDAYERLVKLGYSQHLLSS